jgi:(E)-4-hydroxy-3-methylbut-2-enyl-diphosphate synthase
MNRKNTIAVDVGGVLIGGLNPIVIQSMTDTLTEDVSGTVNQVISLYKAGSRIVRVTVNNIQAAKGAVAIHHELLARGFDVPLVGCFHYNGHNILKEVPDCAKILAKYRINPGNIGFKDKREKNFTEIINIARRYNKPVRIGVNWGSLDQELLKRLMDRNAALQHPKTAQEVVRETVVLSALNSADKAVELGLPRNKIILSAKLSRLQDLVIVYQQLSVRSDYTLHLGLTEAGGGLKGTVSTAAALAILLQQGIGDTIRASVTPAVGGSRIEEVKLCQHILQSLEFHNFAPEITSCPGCGRTGSDYFRNLAADVQDHIDTQMSQWQKKYPGVESMKIAVMGCVVNGPGESKHSDIGISLPGNGENPKAVVYIAGKKSHTLTGNEIPYQFIKILDDFIHKKYSILRVYK